MKTITVSDFLTDKEFKKAIKLHCPQAIRDQIILPNIERINKALGQENDPMFLAYMICHVINQFK